MHMELDLDRFIRLCDDSNEQHSIAMFWYLLGHWGSILWNYDQ
jgi:hypothetical protein